MLKDKNEIFTNWFVIIRRHLTKVSAQIIQCIIFERNELSITIYSSLFGLHPCLHPHFRSGLPIDKHNGFYPLILRRRRPL